MSSDENAVLEANEVFYEALEARNLSAMDRCWSHEPEVACTHPGWHRLDGWTDVVRSWAAIFSNSRPWKVACERARAVVDQDLAVVLCVERLETVGGEGEPARMQATNVFRKIDGRWMVIHHHASPMPDVDEKPETTTVH
jgi:ketosteroid isomerase-like protein